MGRPLNDNDYISIVEIVVFGIFLVGGVLLCLKHDMNKSSGWRFLVVFTLVQVVGSAMDLATINDPTNKNLYIGWIICKGLALGPLILMQMGLLGRVFDSINRQGTMIVQARHRALVQILMGIGLILLIVGGSDSSYNLAPGGEGSGGDTAGYTVNYAVESKVGMAIMILVYIFLLYESFTALRYQGYVAQGEHRIIIANLVCLPFILVRLIYSCYRIFGNHASTPFLYLGASVIMEAIVCLIVETLGFTLAKKVPDQPPNNSNYDMAYDGPNGKYQNGPPPAAYNGGYNNGGYNNGGYNNGGYNNGGYNQGGYSR